MKPPLAACRKVGLRKIQDETGINSGTLSRYERGIVIPKPETAEALAPHYGIKPEEVREYAKMAAEVRRKKAAKQAS